MALSVSTQKPVQTRILTKLFKEIVPEDICGNPCRSFFCPSLHRTLSWVAAERRRKPARFVKFVFDIRIQALHTYHTNFLQTYDLNSGISPMRGPADPEKEIADFSWIKYNKNTLCHYYDN